MEQKVIIATVAALAAVISLAACAPKSPPAPPTAMRACTGAPVAGDAADTRQEPLYAVAELGYEAPDTARQYAVGLLSEFEKVFRLPSPIGFVAWGGADARDSATSPTMAAEASITIAPDGQLIALALIQSSLVAAVDSALLSGVRATTQGGGVLPPSVHGIDKPLTVFVGLGVGKPARWDAIPDTGPAERPVMPIRRMVELPLRLLDLPVKRFSSMVSIDMERSTHARYPEGLSGAGWDGAVDVEYVVSPAGSVIPQTIRVLGGTERRFAAAVLEALKGARFLPARIDGCPVPVLTLQRFEFRAGREDPRE